MRASTYPGPSDNSVNATIEQAAQPTVPPVMQQPVQPAVQPAMQPQAYGQPMNPAYGQPPFMQPVKKKKTGLIIGIIAALAVIATAIILIIVLGGNKKNNTYKAALKTFITGINEQNLNKMYSVLPEPGVRYAKNEIEKYWEGADYYFNEHLDVDEYTVSYKITSVESMNNQNDLYLIEGDLLMYGYQCDVTDSCIVHTLITFTSKTNPNDVDVDDDEEFQFIKINGKWYLYNYEDFI